MSYTAKQIDKMSIEEIESLAETLSNEDKNKWASNGYDGANPSMHRHVPFTFFPKVYTKHMNPPSPLGKGGVKLIKKKLKNSWKSNKKALPLHMYYWIQWYLL
jgi:hypothetical protein